MIRLETLSGSRLTLICTNVSLPKHDVLQVENRLMDGSLHIQTIGQPLKIINLEVLATEINAEKIDEMQAIAEELYFLKPPKKYLGIIRKPMSWVKKGPYIGDDTKYLGEIEFVILGEGSI